MSARSAGAVSVAVALGLAVTTAAVSAASGGGTRSPSASTRAASAPAIVVYGHVRSLVRKGGGFEARIDPAWWLTGVTARQAAAADGAIRPGEPVPNDYYVVDESHRVLTYRVATSARVMVLTRRGRGPIPATAIPVSELAQIVAGRNPRHRQLLEPKAGFWLRVTGDRITALDQQYQP